MKTAKIYRVSYAPIAGGFPIPVGDVFKSTKKAALKLAEKYDGQVELIVIKKGNSSRDICHILNRDPSHIIERKVLVGYGGG